MQWDFQTYFSPNGATAQAHTRVEEGAGVGTIWINLSIFLGLSDWHML